MNTTVTYIPIAPETLSQLIQDAVKSLAPQTPKEVEGDQLYTRAQVAKLLDVDLSTIHNYCKKGLLKPYGIGSRVYFKRSEVEAALTPLI